MSRFKKCAKVAHAKLHTFFPQVSLGQTQQILTAALGHKSYASFLASDLSGFDEQAAYAVLVPSSAMLRALDFGIEMNRNHWDLLISEISEKQVVGDLELPLHDFLRNLQALEERVVAVAFLRLFADLLLNHFEVVEGDTFRACKLLFGLRVVERVLRHLDVAGSMFTFQLF